MVQTWAIAAGLKIDCGCFGSLASSQVGVKSYLLALGMLCVSIVGCLVSLASEEEQ